MPFLSPSHAWATWLDRPNDLLLAASNGAAIRAALDALDSGNTSHAEELWAAIDGDEMLQAWNDQVTGARDKSLWPASLSQPPLVLGPKTTKQLTRSLSHNVFERDGNRCCYCGVPVFTQWKNGDIVRLVTAFPNLTPHLTIGNGSLLGTGKSGFLTNNDVSKWLWVTAVADHVHPASLGGPTKMSNLVTACSGCNYAKADWTLQQLDVIPPRQSTA